MNSLSTESFLEVLLRSSSFWQSTSVWLALSLVTLSVGLAIAIFRFRTLTKRKIRTLHKEQLGTAVAVDFVLTIPIFTFVIMMFVQFALIAHASLMVHYSAYSGARAARVWLWDNDPFRIPGVAMRLGYKNILYRQNDLDMVLPKVEKAVRFSLIPISPVSGRIPCQLDCTPPEKIIRSITHATEHTDRMGALIRKAQYAFDPPNTDIKVLSATELLQKRPDFMPDYQVLSDAWPVSVEVTYKFHLNIAVAAKILGTFDNGHYHRALTADVVLL